MASVWEELKRRNVVRVAIAYAIVSWLSLQLTDVLVSLLSLPEWVGRLVFLLLVIGFLLALILSWAYELTPDGVKKEKDVDRSQSVTRVTGRKLDFVIIGLLVAGLGYFVYDKFVADSGQDDLAKSIAVLPFVSMSSGEDDGYFADGLTEEILNVLAQLPELQVTARTSSFFFKGQNIPVPEIAALLNVAHIVEGSVRRDGKQVRITAQLIRAADGFHLWSQSYDRTLDDIFAVQEDIAENIAAVLNVVLDESSRQAMRSAGIRNDEAFIAYQKGVEAFAKSHAHIENASDFLAIANTHFDRVLQEAPDLVTVLLMKADLAGHILMETAAGFRDAAYPGEVEDAMAAMLAESDRAWELTPPGNQRDILDLERRFMRDDWTGLTTRIQKAMQPGECPHLNWTSDFIAPHGWAEQTSEKSRETLACDPMDFIANTYLPFQLIIGGKPEAALQAVEDAETNGISHPWLEDARFLALLATGQVDDAALLGPKPEGSVMFYDRQIMLEALAGDPVLARQMAEEYWSRPGVDDWSSLIVAALVGDRDRANEFAARIDARPGSVIALSVSVFACYCGAPFDLEVTPNYKARIEEAGFPWPPRMSIDFLTKTW